MTWVLDRGKYVNTDLAVTGDIVTTSRGVRAVVLKDRAGNEVAVVSEDALAPPAIVLAGPTAGVFISDTGEVSWAAIVAWRIGQNGAEPVLLGDRPQGTLFLPQGDALFGMGQLFKDLKSAVAAVVAAESTNQEAAQ